MARFNGTSTTASLAMMTAGRTLPWMRCSTAGGANDPSTTWAIPDGNGGTRPPEWREFVILDHRNEFLMSFDLTNNPIHGDSNAVQRAVVQEALRTAAALPDTDGDRLPDAWEIDEFGNLDAVAADTPTASGLIALLAYGLGQSPHAATETKGLQLTRAGNGYALSYTRTLARRPALLWSFERSHNLADWLDSPDLPAATSTTQYDGSGTERITHLLPETSPPADTFRLKLHLGPDPQG